MMEHKRKMKPVRSVQQKEKIYSDYTRNEPFDKVSHTKLLVKLKAYGIVGEAYEWIKSFLLGKQRIVLGKISSDWEEVTSGVPQGSVLGLILFVIYINDLLDLIQSPCLTYADDLKIVGVLGKNELVSNKLQNDLNELFNWSKKWSTELNLLKCKTMYIGRNRVKTMYAVGNVNLKETIEEKDLGVFVTNDLKWNRQCSAAAAKANRVLGQIKNSFLCLEEETLRLLYTGLLRPHLEYAFSMWNPSTKTKLLLIKFL
ncbi:unnamed protein product [Brachionus calyciflorus]|uniref:Reverse transcriptase domain-containing protein n=1 Tax=Brachionus calyciflorus TaxID=104777 RepID=A0A814EI90_9BILA|nr:unnamed protein product [Brachionus calyciflorus]